MWIPRRQERTVVVEHFTMEVIRLHIPNTARFQLTLGGQQWYIMGCYMDPYDALTIEALFAAISQRPHGANLLVAGNFNANLAAPEGYARYEDIDVSFATEEAEDTGDHLLP